MNLWQKLDKPFFCLAPMADVTDTAFRRIIAKYGKPDVMWTEFVSADGLASEEGREHLVKSLAYTESERPIVVQLFGANSEKMFEAAKLVALLGFDGLDINMGCPDKSIEKQGAGAALMKNKKLAKEIIRAAKSGAGNIPVSVKTRLGFNKDEVEEWIPALLEEGIAALTAHARTRKEMSNVPARWDRIKRVVEIRDAMKKETLIIGNGDVENISDAKEKAAASGSDGVMLGRAIFGNPWLFAEKQPTLKEKLTVMVEHTKLFEELFAGYKSFALMKKHYKAYASGFDGAKDLRIKLMETQNAAEVEDLVSRSIVKI